MPQGQLTWYQIDVELGLGSWRTYAEQFWGVCTLVPAKTVVVLLTSFIMGQANVAADLTPSDCEMVLCQGALLLSSFRECTKPRGNRARARKRRFEVGR